MRTIQSLINKYKLYDNLRDMRGYTLAIDSDKEVCDEDKWLVVSFLRYNQDIHIKTVNKCVYNSPNVATIYNNCCQSILKYEMKKIKPIPKEYLEEGLNKLHSYFRINNKRLKVIAILSIHKEYKQGYVDNIWKNYIDKEVMQN